MKIETLIKYYRDSLSDSSKNNPEKLSTISGITLDHIKSGKIPFRQFDELKNIFGKTDDQNAYRVVICPYVFSPAYSHGVKKSDQGKFALVCIHATVDKEGNIFPDVETPPWIPRDLLSPTFNSTEIGSCKAADEFLSKNDFAPKSWIEAISYANELVRAVSGFNANSLAWPEEANVSQVLSNDIGFIEPNEGGGAIRSLIAFFDWIINQPESAIGNFASIFPRDNIDREVVHPLKHLTLHLGTMSPQFGLSDSQRTALTGCALASAGSGYGDVVAVNGPPGTGKTTLLQSAVADIRVKAALANGDCPLIVASSTNNQAITNILDSFKSVPKFPGVIGERWFNCTESMGIYLKSKTKDSKNYQCLMRESDSKKIISGYFDEIENQEWLDSASEAFRKCFSEVFPYAKCSSQEMMNEHIRSQMQLVSESLQSRLSKLTEFIFSWSVSSDYDKQLSATIGTIQNDVSREFIAHIERLRSELVDAEKSKDFRLNEVAQEEFVYQQAADKRQALLAQEIELANKNFESSKKIHQAWLLLKSQTPIAELLFAFIPTVKKRGQSREEAFWLQHDIRNEASLKSRIGDLESKAKNLESEMLAVKRDQKANVYVFNIRKNEIQQDFIAQKNRIEKEIEEKKRGMSKFEQTAKSVALFAKELDGSLNDSSDIDIGKILGSIDTKLRAKLFALSCRYWEGRYLTELSTKIDHEKRNEGNYDRRSQEKLLRMYRRFSMITPCMVSTFYMLPSFFKCWQQVDSYPIGGIDMLIVDEAGQVTPEVGAPCFMLAKKAIVVGDIFQIEPIWGVLKHTDMANVKHIISPQMYDDESDKGWLSANGSIMKMARRACHFKTGAEIENDLGFLLTEHRRCVPEIIEYCNDLVYGGMLKAMREGIPVSARMLPALGYAHIGGISSESSGSRINRAEAFSIVEWVVNRKEELENHYKKPIGEVLGIITPFAAHKNTILQMINKRIANSNITVGTVHALQGAERDVVIFSPCYGENHGGGLFFDDGPNMMNVALSRARDSFLVFGNMNLFKAAGKTPSALLAKRIFHEENQIGDVLVAGNAEGGDTIRHSGIQNHADILADVLDNATKQVIIASPYIALNALNSGELLNRIESARLRGVTVTVYLNKSQKPENVYKFREAIDLLKSRGTTIQIMGNDRQLGFHNKTLICDEDRIIEGSFNWLSAPREYQWHKVESSLEYRGRNVPQMIAKFSQDMNSIEIAH